MSETFINDPYEHIKVLREKLSNTEIAFDGMRLTAEKLIAENARLQDELAAVQEVHQQVMSERCPTDEKHCTCVPILRSELTKLKAFWEWSREADKQLFEIDYEIAKQKGK